MFYGIISIHGLGLLFHRYRMLQTIQILNKNETQPSYVNGNKLIYLTKVNNLTNFMQITTNDTLGR